MMLLLGLALGFCLGGLVTSAYFYSRALRLEEKVNMEVCTHDTNHPFTKEDV